MSFTLEALDERLALRAAASPDESYTARLLAAGTGKCARKFGEEAIEAIVAATTGDRDGLTSEAADVLYHLLVLLRAEGVPLAEVMAQLASRTAQSGLEEKAGRGEGRQLMAQSGLDLAPYLHFSKQEWAKFRADEPMTLDVSDVRRLRALNDPISLEEAEATYLPLSRLISLYVEATQALHLASRRFLGNNGSKVPYIIGVAGSVAVGKSTTSRILRALLQRWPSSPKVDLVTTDGFLYPNSILEARGLAERKGFPESYDRARLLRFLSDIKSGRPQVGAPVYSHLVYDILPGEEVVVDRPDILIVEGLNILQPGELPRNGRPILFASDFLDFSIFIDAAEADLRAWFMERFMQLRETAFADPKSFFHKLTELSDEEARRFGLSAWESINMPNLRDNILPTRGRADLILTKGRSHAVEEVALRRL